MGWTQTVQNPRKGKKFQFHKWHPSCFSSFKPGDTPWSACKMGMENNMTFKFIELSNSYYTNYIYERLIYNIEERGRAIIMMCPRGVLSHNSCLLLCQHRSLVCIYRLMFISFLNDENLDIEFSMHDVSMVKAKLDVYQDSYEWKWCYYKPCVSRLWLKSCVCWIIHLEKNIINNISINNKITCTNFR